MPDELVAALETVNDDLAGAVREFAHRWYGEVTPARRRAVTFVVLDLPSSAIRRYLLAGRAPPVSLDRPSSPPRGPRWRRCRPQVARLPRADESEVDGRSND